MMTKNAQEKQQSYMKILSTMSEDAKQKAQAELDQLGQQIQAYQNSKFNSNEGELIKTRNELLKPILEKVKNTVTDVAKKKKVDLVLDKNSVIFTGTAVVDLTDDVKKALK
jgi:Skp family chaperone for outer membrane proteins